MAPLAIAGERLRRTIQASRWPIFAILAAAIAARILAATVLPDQGALLVDAAGYREAAAQLLSAGKFDSPYIMPFYPAMIAMTGSGHGQMAADIALSAAIVWLIYALAFELFSDRIIALFSALWAACYPPLIFFSVVGLSETLFIVLMLASFLCWYQARYFWASVFATLTVLTRPVFDLAGVLLTFYFAAVMLRMPWKTVARHVAVYALVYCVLMLPWWLHNYSRYHDFVRLNLDFGTALYAGNNPMNGTGGGNVGEDYRLDAFSHIADPIARDRALRDSAIQFMIQNPLRVIELAGMKFVRMWRIWPRNEGYSSPAYIIGSIVSFAPMLLLAGVYFAVWGWRERFRISPIVLFALYYIAVHMVLVGTIRYRLPLEPFMIIFASAATVRLLGPFAVRLFRRTDPNAPADPEGA